MDLSSREEDAEDQRTEYVYPLAKNNTINLMRNPGAPGYKLPRDVIWIDVRNPPSRPPKHAPQTEHTYPEVVMFWRYVQVWILGGRAKDRYVEWQLPVDDKQVLLTFLKRADFDPYIIHIVHDSYESLRAKPVYVPYQLGGPFRRLVSLLGYSAERKQALFVQCFGWRNAIACEACIETFTKSFVTLPNGSHSSTCWPFPECISMAGVVGRGRCANCLWADKECTWEDLSGEGILKKLQGSAEMERSLPPRSLNPDNCPRVRIEGDDVEKERRRQQFEYFKCKKRRQPCVAASGVGKCL